MHGDEAEAVVGNQIMAQAQSHCRGYTTFWSMEPEGGRILVHTGGAVGKERTSWRTKVSTLLPDRADLPSSNVPAREVVRDVVVKRSPLHEFFIDADSSQTNVPAMIGRDRELDNAGQE
jgi:hypothetical protein